MIMEKNKCMFLAKQNWYRINIWQDINKTQAQCDISLNKIGYF